MQPADLNMTTTVTGHQLFLFVTFGDRRDDGELTEALDLLGQGVENVHDVDGPPSDEAFRRGRFQLLRAEAGLTSEQQIVHPAVSESHGLIRPGGWTSPRALHPAAKPPGGRVGHGLPY